MPQERATSIQYINRLRILSIYAVITAHVTIWQTVASRPFTFHWWLGCWVFWLGHAAIPIFVMISGALLLDDARQESARQFYAKRLYRVGIPLVVWTVVYLLVRRFLDHEDLSVGSVARMILTGNPYYHLWFLYMIFGLYLVTPALRVFIRRSSRGQRLLAIAAILVLANIYFQIDALFWNRQRTIFTVFLPHIGYYLCGYEIRRIDPKKVPAGCLALAAVLSALYLAVFAEPFLARQGGVGTRFVFDFFSLPLVFLAIGIFWAAWLHDATAQPPTGRRKAMLEGLAAATLGVYVLHPLVLNVFAHAFGGEADQDTFVGGMIVVPLVTFAVCYGLTSLIMKVPVLRRTVC